MSHIVSVATQVRDPAAIAAACRRLSLPAPEQGTFRLFSGKVTGVAVRLPDWKYPVVCGVQSGQIHYDNFNGRWGDQACLDAFLQIYAVEKVKAEARRAGRSVCEQTLADGSIKLTVQTQGGAA